MEEEVEHLLPDINNQDVVSEPVLQVNNDVSDMLLKPSKVDREGKHLRNPSSNSSLDSNSARAPEPIRKSLSQPPESQKQLSHQFQNHDQILSNESHLQHN